MSAGTKTVDNRSVVSTPGGCGTTATVGFYYSKTWSGGDLPVGFDRSQWLPPHNYTMSVTSTFDNVCTWKSNTQAPRLGSHLTCWGGFSHIADPSAAIIANNEIHAIMKLRKRIEGSEFDASIFLGTAHQSLRTIAEGATQIYEAYRNVRKGRFKQAKRILTKRITVWHPHIDDSIQRFVKYSVPAARRENSIRIHKDAAKNWLALQYGWLPLLNDVFDAAESLANHLYAPLHYQRSASFEYSQHDILVSGQIKYTRKNNYKTRYTAYYSETASWAKQSGLQNPENLAWELLPWSFVADWFIPVGDYLEARAFSQRMTGTFVKSTLKDKWCGSTQGTGISGFKFIVPDMAYNHSVTLTRTVSSTLDVPLPHFKPLDSVPSWRRCANALALLTQALF